MPVTSPDLPDGSAIGDKQIRFYNEFILTFKEWLILTRIDINLGELANAYLLRHGILDVGLLVEAIPVGAHSPGPEFLFSKCNGEWHREHLVGALGQHEIFW